MKREEKKNYGSLMVANDKDSLTSPRLSKNPSADIKMAK
jgi:hypothetical protein